MSSLGVVGSAGTGKIISELLTYGESTLWNPYHFDVRRMHPGSNNKTLCRDAATKALSGGYRMKYPSATETQVATKIVKASSLITHLQDHGAIFGDDSGWRVPLYFKKDGDSECLRFT